AGEIRRCAEESAYTCIYTFSAGTADDGGKTCDAVDAGIRDGSGRSGLCTGKPEAAGIQGNDGNPGKFPRALRWRSGDDRQDRSDDSREDGIQSVLSGIRTDLFQKSGYKGSERARGNCCKRPQIFK